MASHHLIDPELAAGLEAFPPFDQLTQETLPPMRAALKEMARVQIEENPPQGVEFAEQTIPGPEGAPGVRVLTYRPAKATGPLPVYLHIHGGGMIAGIPEMSYIKSLQIAKNFNCFVVSVDYRLAPETRFPGAIEDCYAALKWVHDNAKALDLDPARVVVAGESAGGGLAACLSVLARDRGKLPITFQLLVYPMLDDRTGGDDYDHPHVGHFVWTQPSNNLGWSAYLGQAPGGKDVSPYAAAARTPDVHGLPPTFIATGALDLFLEEDMEYARRLVRAGVPTELHVYPGAFHAFDMIVEAQVAQAFQRDWQNALRKALTAAPAG